MHVSEAVSLMAMRAGKSRSEVSVEIGRSRSFISASQAKGEWSPQVRTLLEIAHTCGYRLELARDDERIVLD